MLQPINPDMIRLARESLGLTQTELAGIIGVTQGKISKVEASLLELQPDEIIRLADAVGRPVSFFQWRDGVHSAEVHEIFHRRRQQVSQKTLAMVHANMNIRRMQIERLLRSVDITGPGFPQMDPDEYGGDVEKIAVAIRTLWQLPRGPVPNVVEAIENAGGIVVPFDFGSQKVDAMSQWHPGMPPMFFLNTHFPADRTRLSAVHELGHVVMHKLIGPDTETEANRFAAEFLMPATVIRHELHGLTLAKLANLKQYWKVSMQALLVRAGTLGTISPKQAQRLWMEISRLGYRKQEPYPIAAEKAALYKEIFDYHRSDLGYAAPEMAELMGERDIQAGWTKEETGLSIVA
jgi:Zn-dependent peptidase ImmA (M78 family)/transcriptional regulator with XRE-family HTH domain